EILEHGLYDALTGTRPSFLNHHLLGSVLFRAIAANPSYWLVDGPVAPRPELLAKLDRALDAVGREASPYGAIGGGSHAFVPRDARGLTLHFHIVAPTPETHGLIGALAGEARLRRLSLHVSTEATATRDRAYFASARFVRMTELLQSFGRPLLFLDTDTEFES